MFRASHVGFPPLSRTWEGLSEYELSRISR